MSEYFTYEICKYFNKSLSSDVSCIIADRRYYVRAKTVHSFTITHVTYQYETPCLRLLKVGWGTAWLQGHGAAVDVVIVLIIIAVVISLRNSHLPVPIEFGQCFQPLKVL